MSPEAGAGARAWVEAYYEAIDELDFERVQGFLHEECTCVYPNGHAQHGSERILRSMSRSLGALERIRHRVRNVWEEGEQVIFELEVTYGRRDGKVISRPGMGVFVLQGDRIREQRLFVDASGVWD